MTPQERIISSLEHTLKDLLQNALNELRTLDNNLLMLEMCSEEKCAYPVDCRGLCKKHYRQWRRDECKRLGVARLKDAPAPAPLDDTLPLPFPTLPESSSLEEEVAF
jgi:hypothetical protein